MLAYCSRRRSEGESYWVCGEKIRTSRSAKELLAMIPSGVKLIKTPDEKSTFELKGKLQNDGSLIDPVIDWEGNLIENKVRITARESHSKALRR